MKPHFFISAIPAFARGLAASIAWAAALLVLALPASAETNLALGKTAIASSIQTGSTLTPAKATDGIPTSRWGSLATDNEWIYVDLGQSMPIGRVLLRWENAYGSSYKIQISGNTTNWSDLTTITGGNGGVDDLAVAGTGRYVRMLGLTRGTGYGYSLYEFEVYTDPPVIGPPIQTTNQTINLTFPVQGLAYAKVTVSPEPLSVTPAPPEGNSTPSVLNPTQPTTYQITFPPNTNVTISKNQFSGPTPNTDIKLSTIDYTATQLTGTSVTTLASVHQRLGPPAIILGCDCILRFLETGQRGIREQVGEIFAANNVVGFSTYGEQFNAMHVNQTFTGVAIAES